MFVDGGRYVCMYVVVADQTRDPFSRVECREKIGPRVDKEGSATLSVLGGLRSSDGMRAALGTMGSTKLQARANRVCVHSRAANPKSSERYCLLGQRDRWRRLQS